MKQYLITDPKYYSNNPVVFKKNLLHSLKNNSIDIACFRDKESANYEELAKVFIKTCKENDIKIILLNERVELAKKLGATGVHLTSRQFKQIQDAKKMDLYTIISCHSYEDIEKAQKSYVNAVTYSPIFLTPNKGEPKGIEKLKHAVNLYEDINIIALGGIITTKHIHQLQNTKVYAFASIRYFIS